MASYLYSLGLEEVDKGVRGGVGVRDTMDHTPLTQRDRTCWLSVNCTLEYTVSMIR